MAKRWFFFWLLSLTLANAALAQKQEYFVYLQTENLTPFYIRMNGKVISSTASGYLILGQLADSAYPFKLGVLGSNEVQDYVIQVRGNDAGYVIKRLPDQLWCIQNIHTNEVQMSMEMSSAAAAEEARKKAMGVSTPTVQPVMRETATATPVSNKVDSASLVANTPSAQSRTGINAQADSLAAAIAAREQEIKALQDELERAKKNQAADNVFKPQNPAPAGVTADSTASGSREKDIKLVEPSPAVDSTAGRVISQKPEVPVSVHPAEASKAAIVRQNSGDSAVSSGTPQPVRQDTMMQQIRNGKSPVAGDTAQTGGNPATVSVPTTDSLRSSGSESASAIQRQPCSELLSRQELENNMAKTYRMTDTDEIIAVYRASFESKCVTTTQLKKIAGNLVSDVARYKLLEAAYPRTLDYYAFSDLESLLKDTYYLARFRKMIQ